MLGLKGPLVGKLFGPLQAEFKTLAMVYRELLLLTWIYFNPSMDKWSDQILSKA